MSGRRARALAVAVLMVGAALGAAPQAFAAPTPDSPLSLTCTGPTGGTTSCVAGNLVPGQPYDLTLGSRVSGGTSPSAATSGAELAQFTAPDSRQKTVDFTTPDGVSGPYHIVLAGSQGSTDQRTTATVVDFGGSGTAGVSAHRPSSGGTTTGSTTTGSAASGSGLSTTGYAVLGTAGLGLLLLILGAGLVWAGRRRSADGSGTV